MEARHGRQVEGALGSCCHIMFLLPRPVGHPTRQVFIVCCREVVFIGIKQPPPPADPVDGVSDICRWFFWVWRLYLSRYADEEG